MKAGKHLQFYYDCVQRGKMPQEGLCVCAISCIDLIDNEIFELFEPSDDEVEELEKENKCTTFWASDMGERCLDQEKLNGFTSLRQTIILFMAAINNEL